MPPGCQSRTFQHFPLSPRANECVLTLNWPRNFCPVQTAVLYVLDMTEHLECESVRWGEETKIRVTRGIRNRQCTPCHSAVDACLQIRCSPSWRLSNNADNPSEREQKSSHRCVRRTMTRHNCGVGKTFCKEISGHLQHREIHDSSLTQWRARRRVLWSIASCGLAGPAMSSPMRICIMCSPRCHNGHRMLTLN